MASTEMLAENQGQKRLDGLPLRSDSAMVSMPWASTLRAELLLVPSVAAMCSFMLIPYILWRSLTDCLTNAMLVLVKSRIFCDVGGWPDRLLLQTRLRPVWRRGLFRVGAPLGWFGAEQPMYGSRLSFGIQRDVEGNPRMSRTGCPDRASNRKDRFAQSEPSQGFGTVASRQLCRRLLFRLYQPVIPYQFSAR